jgi:hypothetical protein
VAQLVRRLENRSWRGAGGDRVLERAVAAGLIQRDDDHGGDGAGAAPAGAPPVITEHVDEAVADTAAGEAVPLDGGSGLPAAISCQQLTWDDFPGVQGPRDYDAQTGFSWSMSNNVYSAVFDASSSWVLSRWKTDTSPASNQLLRHEQYHLTLVCLLVSKANAAVAGGSSTGTVTRQLRAAIAQYEAAYEADTSHGQNQAAQNTWMSNIDSGAIAFPP